VSGPRIWRPYEKFGGCFKDAGLLDDLTRMLNYTNETLVIIECYCQVAR